MAYPWAWNPFLRSGARNRAASLARCPSFWCPDCYVKATQYESNPFFVCSR